MSECFWTVHKFDENKAIVLFNGNDIGHGSIASVDVPPDDSDQRDEFVKVLCSSEIEFYNCNIRRSSHRMFVTMSIRFFTDVIYRGRRRPFRP